MFLYFDTRNSNFDHNLLICNKIIIEYISKLGFYLLIRYSYIVIAFVLKKEVSLEKSGKMKKHRNKLIDIA